MKNSTSRIPGFYKKSIDERYAALLESSTISHSDKEILNGSQGLHIDTANHMIENVVGLFGFPFAVATNFQINGSDYLIPMVIEEPSVVAAVSNAAKLFRQGGGFTTSSDEPVMIGQVQILDIDDVEVASQSLLSHKDQLMKLANEVGGSIVRRGGGARDIQVRIFENTSIGNMLVLHLLYDTRDAMGANAINTAVEYLAPTIEEITGGRVNLRILSNLTDERKAYAEGVIPKDELARGDFTGEMVVQSIVEAGVFAEVDPYRATTHNKGIMNGIDAVVLATGNDWRAVEAGAHAYAARRGTYSSLTKWWKDDDGNLRGRIELPLAVGVVGGATKVHPVAAVALRLLGNPSARELSEVIAAVGLAQNLAAIRALATEGIQQGHMRMHAKQLAVAAGAPSEFVAEVTQRLINSGNIRLQTAKEIVAEIIGEKSHDDE